MLAVTLKPDVEQFVETITQHTPLTVDGLINKALRVYWAQYQREKISAECKLFDQQKPELLTRYPSEYIAMHQGQVIDHGPDLGELHLRVFAQLGHTPVLLKRVTNEPERAIIIRSPRLERLKP
jgi:hypothetical protein